MDVVIIGAGGHGKVVLDILRSEGKHRPVGFIDADPNLKGALVSGLTVLGEANLLPKLRQQKIRGGIVAIGDSRARCEYAALVEEAGLELISTVHPRAWVSPSARIGRNVVVAANAVINPEAVIGDSTIVNTSAVVEHECQVGIGVHLCPGTLLAGRVRVEDGAFIGIGARVIQCLSIGAAATVGAGAVVLADVPAGATAVGVPAKLLQGR